MRENRSVNSDTLRQGAARRRWISCTSRRLLSLFLVELGAEKSRMKSDFVPLGDVHLLGENAMHPPAPRSTRHAALLLLAHRCALHRRALPGMPITALTGASNGGSQVQWPEY
jgi:hypothetical protein